MMNLNEERMAAVIREAFDKVAGQRRWETAIVKAKRQLESNPYIHLQADGLLILSDSLTIYKAGVACQCKAFKQGQPCWHRALARLVQRYLERSH